MPSAALLPNRDIAFVKGAMYKDGSPRWKDSTEYTFVYKPYEIAYTFGYHFVRIHLLGWTDWSFHLHTTFNRM